MRLDPTIKIGRHHEVYPPSEDTELLIGAFDVEKNEKVLEIGCGSGIVSIHCAKNGAIVTCGDVNPFAVELTTKNAKDNGVVMDIVDTDVYSNINGRFDTIIFNLPYLPVTEDGYLAKSWSGGDDGMGPLPELLENAPSYLNDNGRVIIVVSSLMDQDKLDTLLSHYDVKELAELSLFFEKLHVLEIHLIR